jgi:hypothetical protein
LFDGATLQLRFMAWATRSGSFCTLRLNFSQARRAGGEDVGPSILAATLWIFVVIFGIAALPEIITSFVLIPL